jgi:hypothetical protein
MTRQVGHLENYPPERFCHRFNPSCSSSGEIFKLYDFKGTDWSPFGTLSLECSSA